MSVVNSNEGNQVKPEIRAEVNTQGNASNRSIRPSKEIQIESVNAPIVNDPKDSKDPKDDKDPEDPDERAKKINRNFRKIRPYLFQLITHVILLFLSIYAYLGYTESEDIYNGFAITLKEPLIIDIKAVDPNSACPTDYNMYGTTTIPAPKAGCRCDLGIYQDSICKTIETNIGVNAANANCNAQDVLINAKVLASTLAAVTQTVTNTASNVASVIPSGLGLKRNLIPAEDLKGNECLLLNLDYIPTRCDCYKQLNYTSLGVLNVTKWIVQKKFCYKTGNTNTLEYLSTINEKCDTSNQCQYYFCKKDNDNANACPIADIRVDFGYDAANYDFKSVDPLNIVNSLVYNDKVIKYI